MKLITFYKFSTRLQSAWDEMEKAGNNISPFLYRDYIRNVFNQRKLLGTFNFRMPVFVCVENNNGKIILIAPLEKSVFGNAYRMLTNVRGCGCADFLYSPEINEKEKEKALNLLLDSLNGDIKLMRIMRISSLSRTLFSRKNLKIKRFVQCCHIMLHEDYDTHFKKLSSSVRQNIRTAYNRLKRDDKNIELVVQGLATSHIDKDLYNECLQLYIKRQQSKYRQYSSFKSKIKEWQYKNIIHDSHSLLKNGNSVLVALKIEGKVAAYIGALSSHNEKSLVVPRLAIDNEYGFYSPGYVMLCELIKYLTQNTSIRILDLSRGVEKYKTDLGGKRYYTLDFVSNK